MARPIKNNAEFFTHDADMRNDPKVRAVRRKFGCEGYAVWNFLLEVLTDADYFSVDWTPLNIELLSGDFDVSPERLGEIVDYCVMLNLLQIEDSKLVCKTLDKRFSGLVNKRERRRSGESASQTLENGVSDVQNTQSIVEYSIVKESIVENRKEENNISLSEDRETEGQERESFFEILFFEKKIFPAGEYERFTNHYAKTGWTDSHGNPIIDKGAALRNWREGPQAKKIPAKFIPLWRKIYDNVRQAHPKENYLLLLSGLHGCSSNATQVNLAVTKELFEFIERSAANKTIRALWPEVFGNCKCKYHVVDN